MENGPGKRVLQTWAAPSLFRLQLEGVFSCFLCGKWVKPEPCARPERATVLLGWLVVLFLFFPVWLFIILGFCYFLGKEIELLKCPFIC